MTIVMEVMATNIDCRKVLLKLVASRLAVQPLSFMKALLPGRVKGVEETHRWDPKEPMIISRTGIRKRTVSTVNRVASF